MADTGKQSPLGINVLGSILNNTGLNINPIAASFMGASKINGNGGAGTPGSGGSGYSFGRLVQNTVLRLLTWSIHDGYWRGTLGGGSEDGPTLTASTYNNLITIGANTVPGLGNTRPATYIPEDPAGVWTTIAQLYGAQKTGGSVLPGPATSGYPITGVTGQGQQATWYPWNSSNPNVSVTQWGWIRCHALQAWNAFNWNGTAVELSHPEYKEFTSSYLTANGWVEYSNQAIMAIKESDTFLKGVYSNMSDLISADIAGVNLASNTFGQDLINLGKAIDLSTIGTFGLPSNLLANLGKNSAITQDLSLALIASGLTNSDIAKISSGNTQDVSVEQEQQIYGAFLIITGQNLVNVLAPLQCTTTGFTSLADLLNVKKLFPNSYQSMTVPVYNSTQGLPTNSKTYYLIYSGTGINNQLTSPAIVDYVGVQLPSGPPSISNKAVAPAQYRPLPKGFGSYLKDIIPADQAIAAGAFSFTMRQIRNIEFCNFERFAKAVKGMENTTGLPLTNGTDKPTNQQSTDYSKQVCALGMGPYGTYTMSDLFGCMSGLPYPWQLIFSRINEASTTKLANIYQQNFLAVTWQKARFSIAQPYYYTTARAYVPPTVSPNPANPNYQPDPDQPNYDPYPYVNGSSGSPTNSASYYSDGGLPALYDWWYTVVITQPEDGGGYGRGTAPNPVFTITPNNVGASVRTEVGRNDPDAASVGGGTYGRVSSSINNGGPYRWLQNDVQTNWVNKVGQDTAGNPPTPPILPPRDAAWVEANMPLEYISIQHPPVATLPVSANGAVATNGQNTAGNVYTRRGLFSLGEQGWAAPMNGVVQAYINQANEEITFIQQSKVNVVTYLNTYWNLMGTNLKREHRARYTAIIPVPVPKDFFLNTYPMSLYSFTDSVPTLSQDTRPHMNAQTIEAIANMSSVGGQSAVAMMRQERNQTRLQELGVRLDNNMPTQLTPVELKTITTNGTVSTGIAGIPSPNGNDYTPPSWPGQPDPTNPGTPLVPNPGGIYYPPPGSFPGDPPAGPEYPPPGFRPSPGKRPGDITPIIDGDPNPVVGPVVPTNPIVDPEPNDRPIIIRPPRDSDPTNLPPNLDPDYTGSTLFPSSPTVQQAIDQVIECNCDCWVN